MHQQMQCQQSLKLDKGGLKGSDRRCASALDKEPSKEGKDIEKRVGFVLNIPDTPPCRSEDRIKGRS
ncbi:hypothetical protein IGI04_013396 [Brassica rapa subsp. trilocularis]|uniref:Uncharacterized protein n=1 Tax=Brassica rapa subsp. trilocularis TaxID=1813537 RepID=A0ABQ7N8P8_BRACM|nr:hypothetical protein IGI04_013396 [Brassica rapa subsp. trilocularis]